MTISFAALLALVVSSAGWVNFDFSDGRHIYVPTTIGDRPGTALLTSGGGTLLDRTLAASIGVRDTAGAVDVEIAGVTLRGVHVSVTDLTALAKRLGRPVSLVIGDALFDAYAVDFDFAHHRFAVYDPAQVAKPQGAIEVPLMKVEGTPVVPVSIEGAPSGAFWFGLGNAGEMLVYQSYYAPNKLLDGRRTSQRLAGGVAGLVAETVAVVRRVTFAGIQFDEMPAAFIPSSVVGPASDSISGDIGTPILSRFRLIVNYSRQRLYAVPYADRVRAPFTKDRLGLVLVAGDAACDVRFVSPHSPAEAAGFAVGDTIASVDGKPCATLAAPALNELRYRAAGTVVTLTMANGSVRRLTLAGFF